MKAYITKDTLPQDIINTFKDIKWTVPMVDGLYRTIKDARDNDNCWQIYTVNKELFIRRL